MSRSTLADARFRSRAVLAAGILGGVLTAVFFAAFRPSPPITFDVFYYAAQYSMSGPVVYETGYGLWVYPPVALLFFYPYVWLFDFPTALAVHRVVSALVTLGYGVVLARFIARRADVRLLDQVLVVGFVTASVYPVVNVVNGSFVGIFTALLGIGWLLLEEDRDLGGAAWAVASLVKVYPALWGAYLLRVRRWRATAAAIATGVGAMLLGVALFGIDAHVRYVTTAATGRVRVARFAGGNSPDNEALTPIRGLAQLFPTVDPQLWIPVIVVTVVVLTGLVYYLGDAETTTDRATLLLATVVGVIFLMPTSQDMDVYLVYAPLLVLLYLERHAASHWLYVIGTLLLSYNVGRGELEAVVTAFGPAVADVVMAIATPVLSFGHVPLYGLYALYAGVLLSAWRQGRESGRWASLITKAKLIRRDEARPLR